eukprot:gene2826-81_t
MSESNPGGGPGGKHPGGGPGANSNHGVAKGGARGQRKDRDKDSPSSAHNSRDGSDVIIVSEYAALSLRSLRRAFNHIMLPSESSNTCSCTLFPTSAARLPAGALQLPTCPSSIHFRSFTGCSCPAEKTPQARARAARRDGDDAKRTPEKREPHVVLFMMAHVCRRRPCGFITQIALATPKCLPGPAATPTLPPPHPSLTLLIPYPARHVSSTPGYIQHWPGFDQSPKCRHRMSSDCAALVQSVLTPRPARTTSAPLANPCTISHLCQDGYGSEHRPSTLPLDFVHTGQYGVGGWGARADSRASLPLQIRDVPPQKLRTRKRTADGGDSAKTAGHKGGVPEQDDKQLVLDNLGNARKRNQEFQEREADLEAREKALEAREAAVASREHAVETREADVTRRAEAQAASVDPSSQFRELQLGLGPDEVIEHLRGLEARVAAQRDWLAKLIKELTQMRKAKARSDMYERFHSLGMFVQSRNFGEGWQDGKDILEARARLDRIRESIKTTESLKRSTEQRKRRRKERDTDGKGGEGADGADAEAEDLERQELLHKLELVQLHREDAVCTAELEALETKKQEMIMAVKRIRNEDSSQFRHCPVLHGRYQLAELLGRGGFSEVYKAFDLEACMWVACKIHQLNPQWSHDRRQAYIRHARREYDIHKTLRHPHVVQLLDVFEIDNNSFVTVLEFVEGGDLDCHLKKYKNLGEKEVKGIIFQVVSGLRYLCDQRIIHFDLKPGNSLITPSMHVKITDFGLSKVMSAEETRIELTTPGAGTYWYLPPEVFETHTTPRICSKVDVWSIGVLVYEMIFGRKPFGNQQTQENVIQKRIILNAMNVEFPPKPTVSAECKEFIKRCLTYLQIDRPDVYTLSQDCFFEAPTRKPKRPSADASKPSGSAVGSPPKPEGHSDPHSGPAAPSATAVRSSLLGPGSPNNHASGLPISSTPSPHTRGRGATGECLVSPADGSPGPTGNEIKSQIPPSPPKHKTSPTKRLHHPAAQQDNVPTTPPSR